MKNWGYATIMYLGDYNDRLPLFGDLSSDYTKAFWHAKLAPYVAKQVQQGKLFTETEVFSYELRRCPGGSYVHELELLDRSKLWGFRKPVERPFLLW